MKKSSILSSLFLMVLTIYNVNLLAQSTPYSNFYFCALNGTCFNDENNNPPKVYLILEEYSEEQIIEVTDSFMDIHPEFSLLSPASQLYNCHGFAYSVYQGGEKLKIDWNDDLCSYNGSNTESYCQISESSVQKGDIATIVNPNDNGTYSIHSSIVVNNDTVISKIGSYPVVKHHKYDPWIVAQMGGLGTVTQYTYYHRSLNTIVNGLPAIDKTDPYSYTFAPNVTPSTCTWSVEPAAMFQQSSGSGYTATLRYATPFTYLAPKATLTYTFGYGCDNHYTATKDIDLFVPTASTADNAESIGFVLAENAELTIPSGKNLSIGNNGAPCYVIARSGHCRIIVNGTLSCESNVTFRAENGASLEIIFSDEADLELSGVTFENCQLTLPQRNVTFNSCTFKGTPVQLVLSSSQRVNRETATLRNCTFMPNGLQIQSALFIKNYPQFLVSNCSFLTDNGFFRNGIYIQGAGGNSGVKQVTKNDITGCMYAGLQLYGATASVVGNRIYGNGVGVKLLNNSNISSFSGNCAASDETRTQYIHNNTSYEVYMTGSSIPQTFRYNAICDNGNTPFVYHESNIAQDDPSTSSTRSGSIDVAYNYWGMNFNPGLHLRTDIPEGYLYTPYWTMGECLSVNDRAARQLAEADSLNDVGDYSGASAAYRSVVQDYPNSISAETALKTLLTLEEETGENYGQLRSYYTGNADIASDSVLSNLADNLANKCDVALKNYQDAIEWYENVINDPETSYCDSIFAVIDLGDLYLEMEENGEKAIGKMSQFKPQSKEKHYIQTEKSLELLPACMKANGNPMLEFAEENRENIKNDMFTIFPNPTNDIIRIGGCEADEIEVYNVLGQLVKAVQGTNEISVVGLPEGVYVLRITDEKGNAFTERVSVGR